MVALYMNADSFNLQGESFALVRLKIILLINTFTQYVCKSIPLRKEKDRFVRKSE